MFEAADSGLIAKVIWNMVLKGREFESWLLHFCSDATPDIGI